MVVSVLRLPGGALLFKSKYQPGKKKGSPKGASLTKRFETAFSCHASLRQYYLHQVQRVGALRHLSPIVGAPPASILWLHSKVCGRQSQAMNREHLRNV